MGPPASGPSALPPAPSGIPPSVRGQSDLLRQLGIAPPLGPSSAPPAPPTLPNPFAALGLNPYAPSPSPATLPTQMQALGPMLGQSVLPPTAYPSGGSTGAGPSTSQKGRFGGKKAFKQAAGGLKAEGSNAAQWNPGTDFYLLPDPDHLLIGTFTIEALGIAQLVQSPIIYTNFNATQVFSALRHAFSEAVDLGHYGFT